MDCDAMRVLEEQNELLQKLVNEKDQRCQEIEKNNNFLQNRDLSI
jgi:hypothetical protein